jgi:hypothetical protein
VRACIYAFSHNTSPFFIVLKRPNSFKKSSAIIAVDFSVSSLQKIKKYLCIIFPTFLQITTPINDFTF